ncbi:MAG: hypothetical protein ABSG21_13995 [Spirochaetia bacterium]|jgi:hypothetical protein
MSSRGVSTLLLLLIACHVSAQDWESFAASSDRSADSIILQTMSAGDLETNIAICKGLARRGDSDVSSILESLAAGHSARTAVSTELLLRYLLQGVLDAHPQEASLQDWAMTNDAALDMLLFRITEWRSPQLQGVLLAFAVIAQGRQGRHAIMDVGASLVSELQASAGLIPSEDAALALSFLNAARRAMRSDFFAYCAEIARLSRDEVIVRAARSAASALASAS